ncbi:MAG TPA: response regulator [Kofleriaceae bacterium]|nr:response regulator [Kofleriaceae bacterium]
MTEPGRILIIDDDRDFVAVYKELLESQGVAVAVAYTAEEAARHLERDGADLDVVLLDQKLQGAGGPDSGLALISRIRGLAPFVKTIVVTGYVAPEAIERAFQLGVYDYLLKDGAFEALLRAKVRNALEVAGERRAASRSREEHGRALRSLWARARREPDRNRKGKLLEDLVKDLFRSTPGFAHVTTRLDNEIEEIDIVVENRSEDPLWKLDGASYLIAECKNWSSHCGSSELRNFYDKLTTKYGRARTGFFIAPGGLTAAFHQARADHKAGAALVIPVDADGLDRWIAADDRLAVLRELHKSATFDTAR